MFEQQRRNSVLRKSSLLIFIGIVLVDLFLLYFFKYRHQELSLNEFNIHCFGNQLNAVISLLMIVSLCLVWFLKREFFFERIKLNISFVVISTGILLFGGFLSAIDLPEPDIYILNAPISKIYFGLIFTGFQFFQILWLVVLWLLLLRDENRLVYKGSIVTAILMFVFFLGSFVYVIMPKESSFPYSSDDPADVVVVMGAAVWSGNKPSQVLMARLNRAFEFYQAGMVKKIQVTGSNAPGELSEAEVAYNYLRKFNVNWENILIETTTTSTPEQIRFIKQNLVDKERNSSIIVISDNFHLSRIGEIADFYEMDVTLIASNHNLQTKDLLYYQFRESISLILFWLFAME